MVFKCVEVGIDNVDMVIFFMSMIYGYLFMEVVVVILQGSVWDIGLDIYLLEEIVVYFCEVRKKYVKFEGVLCGVDLCIFVVQVLGGMFINMEGQFKEQGVGDKLDVVLEEIFQVCKDLGFILLVILML